MAQINVTIYREESINELKDLFGGSNNENGRNALDSFLSLYSTWNANVMNGDGKIFTRQELCYLVDIQNATIFEPRIAVSHRTWIATIEDSDELDKTGEKWKVDVAQLIEKVNKLTSSEVYFWRLAINRFWQVEDAYGSPAPDLKKFLDDYAIKDHD
jgi:hypothetical protein